MKVLFLVPYPLGKSPSQRFRFEQYFGVLRESDISYSIQSFVSEQDYPYIFGSKHKFRKALALIKGILRRLVSVSSVSKFDFVFIHREAATIGPPVFEWIIAVFFKKKIIYDFDDAIWLTDRSTENAFVRFVRFRKKVGLICGMAYKVSAGNDYLCSYARQFNKRVILNPTTIQTKLIVEHKPLMEETTTIGWTGSHSTLKYLKIIEPVLQSLEREFANVNFLVIADEQPSMQLERLIFKQWRAETEIEDLLEIDIGVMPLPDDEWSKGKCGFKILQYMALEIPSVASPVGVNTEIISHGTNGYLCDSEREWHSTLRKLIEDVILRKQFGMKGRDLVESRYSTKSNSSNFMTLFT